MEQLYNNCIYGTRLVREIWHKLWSICSGGEEVGNGGSPTFALWAEEIVYGAKDKFPELFDRNRAVFWSQIKRDWYDLDFIYLRKNRTLRRFGYMRAWRNCSTDMWIFFATDAFEKHRQFITAFYRDGAANVKVRETYLSPEELDRFVISAVEKILWQCSDYVEELVRDEICVVQA